MFKYNLGLKEKCSFKVTIISSRQDTLDIVSFIAISNTHVSGLYFHSSEIIQRERLLFIRVLGIFPNQFVLAS